MLQGRQDVSNRSKWLDTHTPTSCLTTSRPTYGTRLCRYSQCVPKAGGGGDTPTPPTPTPEPTPAPAPAPVDECTVPLWGQCECSFTSSVIILGFIVQIKLAAALRWLRKPRQPGAQLALQGERFVAAMTRPLRPARCTTKVFACLETLEVQRLRGALMPAASWCCTVL